ncbi:MAG: DUF3536 domain-containing protein [Sedimentisphaerales bacterium]|nr:DUF3536 domain-containing protein [Sedimentisphaerales bacterium]
MTEKYICIHCHFYQPPRENPWLEEVELQDSAYPYHDWNTRITEECYRRNAVSRILGDDRKIVDIVNNYANISFNFGPTLLSWLQVHVPRTYNRIIEADRLSRERFSGHGCAIAQGYNHMILPLANERDKRTQVLWGIRDFQKHFGRDPEGMWLPETAVNTATLEVLAEQGIRFTILAPRQAQRVRKIGQKQWKKVSEDNVDPSMPYLCNLPSGKQIVLFFYDGPISHDVAYGGLLHSGENFASRLMGAFNQEDRPSQLVHIATDGESFGHHHAHGDMALSYCLHHIQANDLAKVTIYGEYLDKFPPTDEVEIWEDSSWSCVHGVERWRNNCGCAADHSQSGKQEWRAPLREALDQLRDTFADLYETRMAGFCEAPWRLRDDYIKVILDRNSDNVNQFISRWTGRQLENGDKTTFMKLIELQRNAMLMYTSCGWFFDDISGIEAVQIMQYASRAMQLYNEISGITQETGFKKHLEQAPSRKKGFSNGREVYEAYVEPARIDLNRVGAHFALSSIFDEFCESTTDIYAYSAAMEDFHRLEAGVQTLVTSRATIQSKITFEEHSIDLAGLYLGDHNIFAAVRPRGTDEDFIDLRMRLETAFLEGDSNEVMRLMHVSFYGPSYSVTHLFKDQQRQILDRLLVGTWREIESSFRHIYEHNYSIMLMLRNMRMTLPKALAAPAEFIVNGELIREIQEDSINVDRLKSLTDEAKRLSLHLDVEKLRFEASRKIGELMGQIEKTPENTELLEVIEKALKVFSDLTPDLDLQVAQNIFFSLAKKVYPQFEANMETGDEQAQLWLKHFKNLADHLDLVIP